MKAHYFDHFLQVLLVCLDLRVLKARLDHKAALDHQVSWL